MRKETYVVLGKTNAIELLKSIGERVVLSSEPIQLKAGEGKEAGDVDRHNLLDVERRHGEPLGHRQVSVIKRGANRDGNHITWDHPLELSRQPIDAQFNERRVVRVHEVVQDGLVRAGTIKAAKERNRFDFVVLVGDGGEANVRIEGLDFVVRHSGERR